MRQQLCVITHDYVICHCTQDIWILWFRSIFCSFGVTLVAKTQSRWFQDLQGVYSLVPQVTSSCGVTIPAEKSLPLKWGSKSLGNIETWKKCFVKMEPQNISFTDPGNIPGPFCQGLLHHILKFNSLSQETSYVLIQLLKNSSRPEAGVHSPISVSISVWAVPALVTGYAIYWLWNFINPCLWCMTHWSTGTLNQDWTEN